MFRRLFLTCLVLILIAPLAHAASIKLTDIQLEGNNRVDGAKVRAVLSVRPDREVTLEDIDQDIQAIFKLGHFDDISVELREDGSEKVLVFIVHERPLVREIRFEGIKHLTEDKLRPLVTMKTPEIYDLVEVKKSVAALIESYHVEGYHAVKITPQLITDERNESLLTFNIEEGAKILIDAIIFEGNKALKSKTLTAAMMTKKRWIWSWMTGRGTYKAEQIQYDIDLLTALYYDRGYMDVKIKQPQISMVEDGRFMNLLIEIDEGPQYRTGELRITGDLIKPREELSALLTLKKGEIFSRSELRNSVVALTDLYADQGYANANVVPYTSKDPEELKIDLKLGIEQGALIHIEKINIGGNTITRDKVIRRELSLIEGDLYSATKIKISRNRLRNLGFFEEVNVSVGEGSSREAAELDIEVSEKPTGSFTIGAGYSSVDHAIAQGSISQANFMGYGIKLDASATLGGASQLYRIGLLDPYFLDTRWTAGFDLYETERDWSDFSERATGIALKVGHPLGRHSRGLLTYRYEDKEIYNVFDSRPDLREETSLLSSVTATLSRNTTDYRMNPSTGGSTSFSAEYAGLGGTDKFAKLEFSHRHFFPLFWKTVLSINGDIAYVFKTADSEVPVTEKFYLGGLRSIRGFETREVGPINPAIPAIPPIMDHFDPTEVLVDGVTGVDASFAGGEKAAFFNLEFLFPISEEYKLKGLFFVDGGNAWRENDDYFTDMRYSAGYGVRWLSPLGPLRFEWGYNLDPRDDERKSVFEFSIGSFF
jgi:outer membrane protein insertion porin family